MLSGYRFRAYPTAAQAAALRVWIGHQRFIYNAKVKENDYWYKFSRKTLALTGLRPLPDQAYSQFVGPDSEFLRDVPSQVLRNGAYRFATGCSRALKGLGGFPVVRRKHGRQNVLVTSELFKLTPRKGKDGTPDKSGRLQLELGTKSINLGRLHFDQHRHVESLPKMLSISVEPDGRWFVSFCAERQHLAHEPELQRTPEELAYEYGLLGKDKLQSLVVGIDRGVAIPVATSTGVARVIPVVSLARIARKEVRVKRYQRKLARQQLGTKNRLKTKQKIGKLKAYGRNVRDDFAHQVSHELVSGPEVVFAFEDLKLKNMTASPAPKLDEKGRYTANGAAAKAGLNKALLSSALGLVKQYTGYKAAWRNKLMLSVPAAYSSQECAKCGHTCSENRQSQSEFACVACGHTANADINAGEVLKGRAIAQLLGAMPGKKRKKVSTRIRRRAGGAERSPSMPEESMLVTECGCAAQGAVLV